MERIAWEHVRWSVLNASGRHYHLPVLTPVLPTFFILVACSKLDQ